MVFAERTFGVFFYSLPASSKYATRIEIYQRIILADLKQIPQRRGGKNETLAILKVFLKVGVFVGQMGKAD